MSQRHSPPTSRPKRPFWTRLKVGLTAGAVGLLIGIGMAAEPEPAAVDASSTEVEGLTESEVDERVDDQVAAETARFEEQLAEVRDGAQAQVKAAERATAKAVARVKRQAQSAQRRAVATAVARVEAAAVAAAVPEPEVQAFAGTGGGTDPQFGTCTEANAAGYGHYVSGADPEYDWYDDRDDDGVVCE